MSDALRAARLSSLKLTFVIASGLVLAFVANAFAFKLICNGSEQIIICNARNESISDVAVIMGDTILHTGVLAPGAEWQSKKLEPSSESIYPTEKTTCFDLFAAQR